jgi:dTDP-4-amino-4,6-dideoxygalactose transaminase
LDFKLARYDVAIAKRRHLASIYQERLHAISALQLPPGPDSDPNHFDIYQNYEIEAERRDELRAYLDTHGVKTIIQWGGKTLHQFPALALNTDVPRTEAMTQRFLLLPLHAALTDADAHYVCDQVAAFYQ